MADWKQLTEHMGWQGPSHFVALHVRVFQDVGDSALGVWGVR
jgi:hypothetical protein